MFEGIFQPMHLLVILIVAVFVFGPKKLPELGKGLGEGIRGFKKAMSDGFDSNHANTATPPTTTTTTTTDAEKTVKQ